MWVATPNAFLGGSRRIKVTVGYLKGVADAVWLSMAQGGRQIDLTSKGVAESKKLKNTALESGYWGLVHLKDTK